MKKQKEKREEYICLKCKGKIKRDSNYYTFFEYNKECIVHIDYAHRKCWDNFLEQVSTLKNAQEIFSRLNDAPLVEMGLLKPKEVYI